MAQNIDKSKGKIYLIIGVVILVLLIILFLWGFKGCFKHKTADNFNDVVVEHADQGTHTYVETATEVEGAVEVNPTVLATSTEEVATSTTVKEKEATQSNIENDTEMTDIILLPKDKTAVEQGIRQVKKTF
ncbi:hypothetical protein GM182_07290 [bacterium 3DAC]|nr:hypothetical protein GM182_07290 [bacterium 3DAC]